MLGFIKGTVFNIGYIPSGDTNVKDMQTFMVRTEDGAEYPGLAKMNPYNVPATYVQMKDGDLVYGTVIPHTRPGEFLFRVQNIRNGCLRETFALLLCAISLGWWFFE